MSADLNTPPSSPAGLHNGGFRPYGHRSNALSGHWGLASPALSQMTDDESDSESAGSYTPPSFDPPSTPKGHPLENSRALLWSHHFDSHAARSAPDSAAAAVGLGLGLVGSSSGSSSAFGRPKLDLSEDAFEVRERERRASKVVSCRSLRRAFARSLTASVHSISSGHRSSSSSLRRGRRSGSRIARALRSTSSAASFRCCESRLEAPITLSGT